MMSRYLNRDRLAVLAAIAVPLALAVILVPFRSGFPNTDAALALIVVVVAVAANGNRLAGVLAAVSAAVWFDFFLTQPYERFSITAGMTSRPPSCCWSSEWRSPSWPSGDATSTPPRAGVPGYLDGISSAAQAVAAGRSPSVLMEQVTGQLTALLALRSCQFQYGVAGLGRPGWGMTVRSPWSSGSGMWMRRGFPRAWTSNCWCRAAACSRGGS